MIYAITTQILSWIYLGFVLMLIVILVLIIKPKRRQQNKPITTQTPIERPIPILKSEVKRNSFRNAYKAEYLLTINEKNQYWMLRRWADSRNLIVFTKVRLLDLVSPRGNQRNYKTLLWKIQAKHVDFVICDTNIKVKCIIEIMDNSHNQPDRVERDKFVREVLSACGYNVVQTYNINPETLDKVCGFYKEKEIRHDGETVTADETGRTV